MTLLPGMRVMVPFGRSNRRSEGLILSVSDDEGDGLKSVEKVLDETPVLSEGHIRMAAFIRERYFCTFYDAIKAMLPAGLWFRTQEQLVLNTEADDMESLKDSCEEAYIIAKFLQKHGGKASANVSGGF